MNKKVLICASEFPPMPGGIGNHAYCMANELTHQDFEVTVLTELREEHEGDWREFGENNNHLNIIGIKRMRVLLITYLLRVFKAFQLYREGFDVVICSGRFPVWINGVLPKTKSMAIVHGTEIKQAGIKRALFLRGLQKAAAIVCVSRYTRKVLLQTYPECDEDKITVINNGFDSRWADSAPQSKSIGVDGLRLVTVGGIHRRKGQFNVVAALPALMRDLEVSDYRIAGLPGNSDELRALAREKGVAEHVSFFHGLSNEEIADLLNESDVFLMLSEERANGDFEGFGIAILEAMALGLPAIGTKSSGIADAVKDGYSGRLVDPHDSDEVLEALREIASDYSTYSANARKWAERFRWNRVITEYASLIERL